LVAPSARLEHNAIRLPCLWPIVAARIAPAVRPLCGKASLGWDFIASTPNSEMSFQTTGDLCMAATNMVVAFQQPNPTPAKICCSACGVSADAACDCGAPYLPVGQRAAEAIARNPEKSDRAIAAEIGVGNKTVSRARRTVSRDTVAARVGLDGKARRTRPGRPRRNHPPPLRSTNTTPPIETSWMPRPPKSSLASGRRWPTTRT
jgi:hypothetical protein